MTIVDPKVDALLSNPKWHDERKRLRDIVLDCQLAEAVKWGKLCYTFENSNVAILYSLKDYFAIGFFKGALLSDPNGILRKPGANSQSSRWIKFLGLSDINEMEPVLRAYIDEAIEVEKSGLKVDFKEKHHLVYPDELVTKMDEDPAFKTAFEALTPGRQRGYNLFFSAPKESKTKASRIEKSVQKILLGKGMHDR